MTRHDLLTDELLGWLLEKDDPGIRYLALRDLLDRKADDRELSAARIEAHTRGSIATILSKMEAEGYWVEPGPSYYPKYQGTVWYLG